MRRWPYYRQAICAWQATSSVLAVYGAVLPTTAVNVTLTILVVADLVITRPYARRSEHGK